MCTLRKSRQKIEGCTAITFPAALWSVCWRLALVSFLCVKLTKESGCGFCVQSVLEGHVTGNKAKRKPKKKRRIE